MSLRKAFAAALQQVRVGLGRSQREAALTIDQSHLSRLETAQRSATVGSTAEISDALGIQPMSFLALVFAADERRPARQVLLNALAELEELELADALLPAEPEQSSSTMASRTHKRWEAVQAQKRAGATQSETAALLGMSTSAVGRLWHRTYD